MRTSLLLTVLIGSLACAQAPAVQFSGTVTYFPDPPLPPGGDYPGAAGVGVKVIRKLSEAKEAKADGKGIYEFTIEPGTPVLVLFHGPGDLKPELKILT